MNVIITGASKGIGYQTALSMCDKGIENLILISRNKLALESLEKDCKSLNTSIKTHIIAKDLVELLASDKDFLKNLAIDKIDILINNAGLLINKPFTEFTSVEGKRVFDVNFHVPAQLIALLTPYLIKSETPHIVNISSVGGFQGSSKYSGLSYYSASKAALATLTECLAVEFSDTGIKTNCLALGAVQTEMLEEAFPGYKAPTTAKDMGAYIADFALNGFKYYNGQILPVRLGNP